MANLGIRHRAGAVTRQQVQAEVAPQAPHADGVAILAQALNGDTDIGYTPRHITRFDSAFALASYDIDDLRLSGRAEFFATRSSSSILRDEDGHALTAAASWNARSWLRLTGELIQLSSRRLDRAVFHVQPDRTDTQFQLSTRLFL